MDFDELRELIQKGESDRIEFKKSTGQRTAGTKAVCAMLNGLGGFVLFGVNDKGEIVGQVISTKSLEVLSNELRKIEPPAFPQLETFPIQKDKGIIVLAVPGGGGPFCFDGRPYVRNGPTTYLMPREEYEKRLMEKLYASRRWENQPVPEGVTINDLDHEEIQNTFENAIQIGRLERTVHRDVESILRGLELIHDGKLLNAALALFGKSDRLKVLFPQFEIRMARFRGENRLADFGDNRQYWGHAFSLLRRAESFLRDHVPIAGHVVPGEMVRYEQPLYPFRATREAIANAICHRDFSIPGGAVSVAMYDNALEVANPGIFHFGISPEKLTQPHESKPWNPIIANVFYRSGIIERWGSGTLNMLSWCKENGNPSPVWREQANSIYVIFHPPSSKRDQVGTKSGPSRDQVDVLRGCLEERGISELMTLLGRANRTKFRDQVIRPMLDTGWVEMTIPEKPRSSKQKYRTTEKGRHILQQTWNGKDGNE